MYNFEGHIVHAYIYNVVFHLRKCEKGIACARGCNFDIDVHMSYFNGIRYHLKRHVNVEGNTHFK